MLWTMDKALRVSFWSAPSFLLAVLLSAVFSCSFWATFTAVWAASGGCYALLASMMVSITDKAVLVTGCDTGFGHGLALRLAREGFRVFACCLNASSDGARKLSSFGLPRLHILQLDITDQEQVNKVLNEVKDLLPPGEMLWGVVNNAGVSSFGAVEWVPLEVFKGVAEVNIFGHIRVIKAFLPLLRRSRGRLVNVTSAEGRFSSPTFSAYDMTKHAMEGFSDCLRNEVSRFGVHVCLIEPGNYTAGTMLNCASNARKLAPKLRANMTEEVRKAYGEDYIDGYFISRESAKETGLVDLTTAVEVMMEALRQRFPQQRYTCMDLSLFVRMLVSQHLPEWIHDYLYFYEEQKAFYS